MVATQERPTAILIDRLGHTAPQGILPMPEFEHLAGSVIEVSPEHEIVATQRDLMLLSVYNEFLAFFNQSDKEIKNPELLIIETLGKAFDIATEATKKEPTIVSPLIQNSESETFTIMAVGIPDSKEVMVVSSRSGFNIKFRISPNSISYEDDDSADFNPTYLDEPTQDELRNIRRIDDMIFHPIRSNKKWGDSK